MIEIRFEGDQDCYIDSDTPMNLQKDASDPPYPRPYPPFQGSAVPGFKASGFRPLEPWMAGTKMHLKQLVLSCLVLRTVLAS
jgi:hypothetical protein